MGTYSIDKTNADIGETVTLSRSEDVYTVTYTFWVIDLQPSDYSCSFLQGTNNLNSKGKIFSYHSALSETVTLSNNHTIAHTLTPVTVGIPTTQYMSALYTSSIYELESDFYVDIGETIEVNFNRNIYNQLKFLVNRWTKGKENTSNKVTSISSSSTNTQYPSAKCVYDDVKDKLERTTNDTVQVIDTLTDDARCKNSWTYWGQYQGLSNLTNSSFSLSAQGTGGVKYTNNDPNEEDVRLTVTLTTSGNAFIGDDEDYDNSSMYTMGARSEEIFTLEYGSSVWIQYNDTGLLNFTYSVQGVTDGEINSIANIIYPIGSIYMSVNSTSPQVLFGGKWTQLKDRFLLGTGNIYSNGATGGSSTVALTKAEMPRHTHIQNSHNHQPTSTNNVQVIGVNNDDWTYTSKRKMSYTTGDYYYPYSSTNNGGVGQYTVTGTTTATNKYTGGTNTTEAEQNGSAHENMPPYLAVYMWKRIA